MANIKVSEMTEATSFDDGDYTMIVQANQNKKISHENILGNIKDDISTINNNISLINTNISNITGQILWTNPNPTSSFSTQTITLSSDNYDMYEVIYYSSITLASQMSTGRIKKGQTIYLQQTYYDINLSQIRIRQRDISYGSGLSLNIQNAKTNGNTENTALIPMYVIGYKTGLFNNEGE